MGLNSAFKGLKVNTNQTSWESRMYVGDKEKHTVFWTANVMG